jgi:hypothetical protein
MTEFVFPQTKGLREFLDLIFSLLVIKLMLTCIINIHTKSEPEVEVMFND